MLRNKYNVEFGVEGASGCEFWMNEGCMSRKERSLK